MDTNFANTTLINHLSIGIYCKPGDTVYNKDGSEYVLKSQNCPLDETYCTRSYVLESALEFLMSNNIYVFIRGVINPMGDIACFLYEVVYPEVGFYSAISDFSSYQEACQAGLSRALEYISD